METCVLVRGAVWGFRASGLANCFLFVEHIPYLARVRYLSGWLLVLGVWAEGFEVLGAGFGGFALTFLPEAMRQDVLLDATVARRKHLKDFTRPAQP